MAGIIYDAPTTARLSAATIDFTSTGDNTIVAAVASQTVRVHKMFLNVSTATNITFKSGAGTSLTGAMNFPANGGIVLDFDAEPWFLAASGAAFIINQSGTAQVSGRVYYTQS